MNWRRSLKPALVCLLVWLLLAGAAPTADAFDGSTSERASEPAGRVWGKGAVGDQAARISEDPVGRATGRGFNPSGTVASAFQVNCADDADHWICNPDSEEYGDGGGSTPTPVPTPTPTPTPDPRIAEREAYDRAHAEAVTWLNEQQPGFDIAPPKRGQVVNLRNFMWIYGGWESAEFDNEEDGVEVTVTVTPSSSLWRLEEQISGRSFEYHCAGRGHEYTGNPNETSTCGHTFDHSSSVVGDVVLTAAVVYELTVVSTLADSRSNFTDGQSVSPSAPTSIDLDNEQDAASQAIQFPLWVNEVLTWGVQEAGLLSAPQYDGDPVVPVEDGYSCGWQENVAYYATVGVPLRVLGVTCGDTFGLLDTLKNGIVECAGGVADSIGQTVELLVGAATDPVGTVKEGIAGVQALIDMATEDPGNFVATIGFGALGIDKAEWDEAVGDPDARLAMAIRGICGVAFEILVGGAAKRLLNYLPIGKRPNLPGLCPFKRSSFPTGTQVRMGTGELVSIEDVEPGDYVRAGDPATGDWSNQVVLDQWSYLDTDHMTTATLTDGSTITATDHHLFWVESSQDWVELEYVETGDALLTPHGVTAVASVLTHPQAETLVWELDTAGPDTFTVHTGTTDLLVHNANICRPGNKKDTLDGDPSYREGLSPRETAKLERFLGLRKAHLDKWFEFDWDGMLPPGFDNLRTRLRRTENSIEGDLDASDVAGRTKEAGGQTTPADHIGSTNRGVESINNTVEAIDEALTRPGANLSADAVDALTEMRDDLTGLRDEMIDATIPRTP